MSEWIQVNGARIEKGFFDENVEEARRYDWVVTELPNVGHTHCMICGFTMPTIGVVQHTAYKSRGGWVDPYCFEHFVLNKGSKQ